MQKEFFTPQVEHSMHSLKVNNAIYNANFATMPDVQLFLLINYFLKTKPGKVQNWHRVKQRHFARRLMYIKSNTVIYIQSAPDDIQLTSHHSNPYYDQ